MSHCFDWLQIECEKTLFLKLDFLSCGSIPAASNWAVKISTRYRHRQMRLPKSHKYDISTAVQFQLLS